MPQLDFSSYPSQLFWLALSFAALYFVLAVVVLPRLAKVQELRAKNTRGKREEADIATQRAEKTMAEYEALIAQARAEALREAQGLRLATDKTLSQENESTRARLEGELKAASSEVKTFLAASQAEVASAATETAQEIFQTLTKVKG